MTTLLPASAQVSVDPYTYMSRGKDHLRSGQYKKAISDFTKAIEISPWDAVTYGNRGNAFRRMGQYKRAISDFNKAVEIDPGTAWFYNDRGLVYNDLGQYKRAISDFNKALEVGPQHAALYYGNRGYAFRRMRQYKRAISDFDKSIEINSTNAWVYNGRGLTYENMGQYKRAISDYDKVLEINPKDAWIYLNRGSAYRSMKQYKRAISDFDKALEINPKIARFYHERGATYTWMDQYKRAMSDYDKALEINPKFALAYFNKAFVFETTGRVAEAIEAYKGFIKNASPEQTDYVKRARTSITKLERLQAARESRAKVAGGPSFYWEFINVEIDVQENGDMLITETQKYVFTGPYTNERDRYIPLDKVDAIESVQVFEKEKELPVTTGVENNQLWIRWRHTLNPPESHTFILKYRVVGGLQLVEDLWGKIRDARVYWKAIFKDRTTFIQRAKVTVRLPDPLAGQIRYKVAWGVSAPARVVDAQTVEFVSRGPLPPGKELGVDVAFPHGLLSVPAPAWQLQLLGRSRLPLYGAVIFLALVVFLPPFLFFFARRRMRACHACDRPGLRPTGRSKTYGETYVGGRQLELECSYCNSQEWKNEEHFRFGGVGFGGAGGGGGGGGG